MMEVIDAGRDVVFRSDHRLEAGWIILGDAPGLGITFDEQLLAQHAVDRPSAETLGRRLSPSHRLGNLRPGHPCARSLPRW